METMLAKRVKSILVVDDEDQCRLTMKWLLESIDYSVEVASSAEEALSLFKPEQHDLVVTDNSMTGMTGGEMALRMKQRSPRTTILMYTALPPENLSSVDLCIEKPAPLAVIREAISQLLEAKDRK